MLVLSARFGNLHPIQYPGSIPRRSTTECSTWSLLLFPTVESAVSLCQWKEYLWWINCLVYLCHLPHNTAKRINIDQRKMKVDCFCSTSWSSQLHISSVYTSTHSDMIDTKELMSVWSLITANYAHNWHCPSTSAVGLMFNGQPPSQPRHHGSDGD